MDKRGQQVRKFRQKVRLTQEKLASRAGISRSLLARFEEGNRNLSPRTLAKLEAALDKEIFRRADSKGHLQKRKDETQDRLLRLLNASSLEDPVVKEIIESFRREIEDLERQLAERKRLEQEGALGGHRTLRELLTAIGAYGELD